MATVPAWALVVQGIRYHDLSLGPLVGVVCFTNWCCVFHKANCAKEMHVNDVFAINLSIYTVAEPPELSRLKCAGHHHKGNTDTNALQTEQFLVCRVTSRLKASRPLIRVLVINDNGLWINDFIWDNEYRLIHGWKRFGCERMEFWRWWAKLGLKANV